MNIILVSNYFPPEMGAAANRIGNLAEGLCRAGHTINVVCPLPNYPSGKIREGYRGRFSLDEIRSPNLSISRYWIFPSVSKSPFVRVVGMLSFATALWAFVKKFRTIQVADWVIIQNSPLLVSFSSVVLFGKIFRKKLALNVSDLWPLSALELGAIRRGPFYRALERIEKFNYKNSSLIIGQSQEIIDHVCRHVNKPMFLYRNVQPNVSDVREVFPVAAECRRLVYAGLLGVAQGVLEIVRGIDFREFGVEFHIFGDGNERRSLEAFLKDNPNRGVKYFGVVAPKDLRGILRGYDAALVPLVADIRGAVPSKIFELCQVGVPIIFSGGGEGARLVEQFGIGFVSPPGDVDSLKAVIQAVTGLSESRLSVIRNNCKSASETHFNFDEQLRNLEDTLAAVKE